MDFNFDEYVESVLSKLIDINHINPADLPNIELYMDQVTTFMDTRLNATKRHPDDKILTKTMINNYAKNNLLPPPVKKKYSKEHMLTLIFIYYFKSMLSISDIQTLISPISDKFFENKDGLNLDKIYKEIYKNSKADLDSITEDVRKHFADSKSSFPNADDEDREFLQFYSFVCSMAFEVYIKKYLIEQMIDGYFEKYQDEKNKESQNNKSEKKPKKDKNKK